MLLHIRQFDEIQKLREYYSVYALSLVAETYVQHWQLLAFAPENQGNK